MHDESVNSNESQRHRFINKHNFAMMCLVLKDLFPALSERSIIREVCLLFERCGPRFSEILTALVYDYIERKVALVQQENVNLDFNECESLVVFAFLWNASLMVAP